MGIFIYNILLQRSPEQTDKQITTPSPSEIKSGFHQSVPTAIPTLVPTMAITPEDVVKAFYTWYISFPQSPYKTATYKTNVYLTDRFKQNIANMTANNSGPNDDVIFCPFNKLPNVTYDQAQYNAAGDKAQVMIRSIDGRKLHRVVLFNINGRWLINDTICIPTGY